MSYFTSPNDRRDGIFHLLEGLSVSSYYHPSPAVATTRNVQMDRYHEPIGNIRKHSCVICLSDDSNGGLCIPTPRCTHLRSICAGCRTQYLYNMICVQGLTRVNCPQTGCHQNFTELDIERWGDSPSKSRRSALESLRSVQAASIPRNKRADERASAEYLRAYTKPCPSCAAPVHRREDAGSNCKSDRLWPGTVDSSLL
ncbi:hypothetical protein AG1IA_06311 [Rhizoctonia solani AG-1 IA]|uniref:IBR domain-containing protein n=1 Tax=Thanatephorus cucumeris (strain AG1-IA) TaxID=983506 RepID=L8WNU8_THACA|nr:hypothetical protein AG1IA_06311 [Rhizoctonia solani AG-1 IA]